MSEKAVCHHFCDTIDWVSRSTVKNRFIKWRLDSNHNIGLKRQPLRDMMKFYNIDSKFTPAVRSLQGAVAGIPVEKLAFDSGKGEDLWSTWTCRVHKKGHSNNRARHGDSPERPPPGPRVIHRRRRRNKDGKPLSPLKKSQKANKRTQQRPNQPSDEINHQQPEIVLAPPAGFGDEEYPHDQLVEDHIDIEMIVENKDTINGNKNNKFSNSKSHSQIHIG